MLIFVNTFRTDIEKQSFWTVQCLTALFVWAQVLLYLKIFEKFSYLVRMITQGLKDMTYFLIIFILGVFLFSDTFQAIEEKLILRGDIQYDKYEYEDMSAFERFIEPYFKQW